MNSFLAVTALAVFLVGCTPVERDAYNIVVAGKASLVTFRAAHPECSFNATTGLSGVTGNQLCVANNKLTSAKDLVIDTAEVYCSGPSFETGGACQPPIKGTPAYQQAYAKLQAAVSSYKQTATDLKGVIQ